MIIDGHRILTNAHVVTHASQIYVQGHQSADKIPARTITHNLAVDLATLELDDESFFDGRPALPISNTLPRVEDAITVYGYPTGGEKLSVTAGIVSRIDYTRFGYAYEVMRLQIDAALNPGNSGGPAIIDGEIAGVAVGRLREGDDVGYVIAAEEVHRFLRTVSGIDRDRKPYLPISVSWPENGAIRDFLEFEPDDSGIVVTEIRHREPSYPLHEFDVITHIGGQSVDNEGRVQLRDDLKVMFTHAVSQFAKDGQVDLTIIRGGKKKAIQAPVVTTPTRVIELLGGDYPRYFIYGPIVFSVPSYELAQGLISKGHAHHFASQDNPILTQLATIPAFDGEEMVMIAAPPFPHRIAKGYKPDPYSVLSKVNDVQVRNLRHLVELLRDATDEFIIFEFANRTSPLVFHREEIEAATEEILEENGIRYRCSPELRDVWGE